jgi:hypothetical protein
VIQEVFGMLYLISGYTVGQVVILLGKLGIPPVHWWVTYFYRYLKGYTLVWFLVVNKFPFIFVLSQLVIRCSSLLFLGLICIYFQMRGVSGVFPLLLLNSLERFR